MKQLFTLFIFLFFSNFTNAQNLTLGQLLEIKKKDLGNVEEFLIARGWEFVEAKEPDEEKLGSATFAYEKDIMSDRAESFLTFLYSDTSNKTRISIQVCKKIKYNEYINSIKSFGCKLISSKVENGNIIKIYRGLTTTFKIVSSTTTNFYDENTAVWNFFIVTNEDYDYNWGEE